MARSYGGFVFRFMRDLHSPFHDGYVGILTQWIRAYVLTECIRVLVSLTHQNVLDFWIIVILTGMKLKLIEAFSLLP